MSRYVFLYRYTLCMCISLLTAAAPLRWGCPWCTDCTSRPTATACLRRGSPCCPARPSRPTAKACLRWGSPWCAARPSRPTGWGSTWCAGRPSSPTAAACLRWFTPSALHDHLRSSLPKIWWLRTGHPPPLHRYTYIYICVYTCTCACMYMCACKICVHTHMHMYMYMCINPRRGSVWSHALRKWGPRRRSSCYVVLSSVRTLKGLFLLKPLPDDCLDKFQVPRELQAFESRMLSLQQAVLAARKRNMTNLERNQTWNRNENK